jgi:hypothetical protein
VLAENHRKFLEEYQKETTKFLDMDMPGKKTAILQLAPGLKLEWTAECMSFVKYILTPVHRAFGIRLSKNFGIWL